MRYLIIGSGGREHALSWRLLNDGSAREVYVAPGNGGIHEQYRVNIQVNDFEEISKFCIKKKIDIVVVGPEAPLCNGIVDEMEKMKIPIFGPSKRAAQLEGSKLFAKMLMEKYGIPTAGHRDFNGRKEILEYIEGVGTYPIVIKLDGLAGGKGVGIPDNKKSAIDFIKKNVKEDSQVFIEDYLEGEEVSVLGISDGESILPFISAQDHKRIYDGDSGPNTGGMGAYSPAPVMNDEKSLRVYNEILKPTVDGMKKEGFPFKGILYAGIIVNGDDIKILEFNVRFGDPEVQVILPLLDTRLGDLIQKTISGDLGNNDILFNKGYAISVVMASGGYPGSYKKGVEIHGLDSISDDIRIFHGGTDFKDDKYYTQGGRVLNVTAIGDDFISLREKVYSEIEKLSFKDAYFRRDIGHRAIKYLS